MLEVIFISDDCVECTHVGNSVLVEGLCSLGCYSTVDDNGDPAWRVTLFVNKNHNFVETKAHPKVVIATEKRGIQEKLGVEEFPTVYDFVTWLSKAFRILSSYEYANFRLTISSEEVRIEDADSNS